LPRCGVAKIRGLEFEFVRATEAAEIASGRFVGLGDTNAADQAAVDAMRVVLDDVDARPRRSTMPMRCCVSIR